MHNPFTTATILKFRTVIVVRSNELLQAPEPAETSSDTEGRRRVGRPDQVNPNLIPLLRHAATVEIPASLLDEVSAPYVEDGFGAGRGVVLAVALSVPSWAVIGAIAWAVLR